MSTVDELSRSAPITTVSPPPEPPSSEVQPVSPASSSVEATTDAVARRGSLTAVPPRGAQTRYAGGDGDRPRRADSDYMSARSRQTLPTPRRLVKLAQVNAPRRASHML